MRYLGVVENRVKLTPTGARREISSWNSLAGPVAKILLVDK